MKPSHFAGVLRPIWLDKKETASRVKQRCHAVMGSAWAHDFVSGNPLDVVTKLLPVQKQTVQHQPAMPWMTYSAPPWLSGAC
ncbi:phage integrase central domain-containing protein [Vogesella indigofera]|uniref:phage integrase central domain-containing protein n=1 Tax=Vogesella indigofera TaxID=45465 RepID=UPI003570AB08